MTDTSPASEPASIDAMAALEFEPWQRHAGEWTPPSNAEWASLANPHLVTLRLAWLTLHKSKDELIGVANQLGDEALMDLVDQIGQSADWFKGFHELLSSAECRIMCAYATASMEADRTP